ncbi:MAG: hypothetical protein SCALA702_10890 [Melioribacteraceae bacterium]|nr:MAG: hypothetical protein SCALA702_10890 [Melioribacteraceae bacterium]
MLKISWSAKLLIFSVIVAAVPLMITGYNILGIAEEELKSNLNSELLNSVNGVSEKVDNYFEDWIRNLIIISDGIEDQNLGDNERYSFLYNGIGNIPDVINCSVYIENDDNDWNLAVELNRETFANQLEEISLKTRDIVRYDTKNFPKADVGNFVQGTEYLGLIEKWAANLIIPFKTDGGLNGVLACKMDLSTIELMLGENYVRLDNEISVLADDSLKVFASEEEQSLNFTERDVAGLLVSGNRVNGVVSYEDDGVPVVGSYTFTRYPKWGIITETVAEAAYTPVLQILYSLGLWVAIGIIMAVSGAMILSRQISSPVSKISDASKQIASGEFAIKIDYDSKDSLGKLSRNIEKMASSLAQSFREIEFQKKELQEYNLTLEAKVKERTEKLDKSNSDLKAAYLRLVELNREKDEFLGITAHDLKNPLAAIRGYSELLIDETDPDEIKQFGTVIFESSERMLEIINLLLTINRVEQGNYTIQNAPFDAASVVKQLLKQNERNAEKKEIDVVYKGDDSLEMNYDKVVLGQIIDNLLSNAIKFSHNNTKVVVKLHKENNDFSISVKDEGQGIPEEDQERVFDKFSKLSVKPTGGENSTGLGLSIVKGFVELSGGTITFKSKPGTGTEFIVKLPVQNS